jgi:hypothetical protein
VPLCLLALAVAHRERGWRALSGVGVAVGYGTHLFGDAIYDLLALNLDGLTFLMWPFLAAPNYATTSFDGHVEQFRESVTLLESGTLTPFVAEWVLFVLMVVLWVWHRGPPLSSVLSGLRGRARVSDAGK